MAADGPPTVVVVFFSLVGAFMVLMILFSVLKNLCKDPPPHTRSRRVAAVRAPASSAAPARDVGVPPSAPLAADGGAGAAVLEMLPEFTYSPAAQKKKLNCSVCLMDLRDGERGRFLPNCFHCFHVECIDAWLAAHSECPVCRASISPAPPELAV